MKVIIFSLDNWPSVGILITCVLAAYGAGYACAIDDTTRRWLRRQKDYHKKYVRQDKEELEEIPRNFQIIQGSKKAV